MLGVFAGRLDGWWLEQRRERAQAGSPAQMASTVLLDVRISLARPPIRSTSTYGTFSLKNVGQDLLHRTIPRPSPVKVPNPVRHQALYLVLHRSKVVGGVGVVPYVDTYQRCDVYIPTKAVHHGNGRFSSDRSEADNRLFSPLGFSFLASSLALL